MRAFALLLAVAALASAAPASQDDNIIMTFADDGKTPIFENLNDKVPAAAGVDMNSLKMCLYTRQNRDTPQFLKNGDTSGLKNSHFVASKPTKFVIHGWQNSYKAESVQLIKDSYLQTGDVNVVLFDYEAYNSPYVTAVSNAQSIGEAYGTFVNFLVGQGLSVNNIHLIGHSLGAHITGYTANKVNSNGKGKVPRCTGLDPAGPMFADAKAAGRLSSDDCTQVDCVHTSNSLGMDKAIGTADYYPNGGSKQPACASNAMADGCDHASSYRYFAETIGNRQRFPARSCKSEAMAKESNKNQCTASSNHMGEDGHKGSGYYFVAV